VGRRLILVGAVTVFPLAPIVLGGLTVIYYSLITKEEVMHKGKHQTIDGLPIVDSHERAPIHITKNDVRFGAKKSPGKCAAALAAKRDYHADEARVHLGRTYLRFGKKWVRYLTPISLKAEIISFDRGGTFSPGDYVLGKMPPAKTMGKRQSASEKRRKHPRKRRGPYHIFTGVRRKVERRFSV